MTDNHPITPPPELLAQWEDDILDSQDNVDYVLDCAWRNGFQAGADQELEACITWVAVESLEAAKELRAARRPEPLSLKEQALAELEILSDYAHGLGCSESAIRRALEALP